MADYDADVIIVGAGHNSLTAALYIQKAGHKVLIIEKAEVPGGASKTAELLEPGFKHDLYATNIGQFLGSRVYADFQDAFRRSGFDIVAINQPFANVFPNGNCIRMYTDAEKAYQELARFASRDGQAWNEMVAYFSTIAPYMFPILQLPIPSVKMLLHFWKIYRQLGFNDALNLVKVLLTPTREFFDERFQTEEAKALLSPWAFHLGLSPDCAGGATFSFLESVADHLNGLAISKGGVGNLIHAMVKVIEEGGGRLLYGNMVTEIVTHNGAAVGVKTADGQTYHAKKAVLATVTPRQFIELVDQKELPEKFVTSCRNFQYGPGTLMIHLTLNKPLEWEAAEDLTNSAYIHIAPYVSDISNTYSQIMNGLLPSNPLLVVAQQSIHDPERAPEGKHVMWIQARAFPQEIKGDALDEIKVGSWDTMKEPIYERIINKISVYAPQIRDIIRKAVVHTPQDLENDDPNLVGGDMVGGAHHLHQFFLFRPVPGWSRYKTPVKRLYLTGQSTWPGCGMNASAGHLAAMELLRGK
ncbi:MAG: NAD(P)/FAD-dependent oxidoreductase [Deltaproteobacteria bacterium]|nr:NAD(P)/FAD-dependent oxidoreductase [Deltaproteobacteria bacterium]